MRLCFETKRTKKSCRFSGEATDESADLSLRQHHRKSLAQFLVKTRRVSVDGDLRHDAHLKLFMTWTNASLHGRGCCVLNTHIRSSSEPLAGLKRTTCW